MLLYLYFLGVYTFKNGVRVRFTKEKGNFNFDHRLIFPEDDVKLEYRGDVKDGCVMHGKGTLTLRSNHHLTYTGEWHDGVSANHSTEISGIE